MPGYKPRYPLVAVIIIQIICIFIALCMFSDSVYAHQDFMVSGDYTKVRVRIETGFNYEEIEKVKILGQMANKLIEKYYPGSPDIMIDYEHMYTDKTNKPDYTGYLVYMGYKDQGWPDEQIFDKNGLLLHIKAKKLDLDDSLKIVEYLVMQHKRNGQKDENIILSGDTLKQILEDRSLSDGILDINTIKFYRSNAYDTEQYSWNKGIIEYVLKEFPVNENIRMQLSNQKKVFEEYINNSFKFAGISYYYLNHKFYIYNAAAGENKILLTLNDIYYFHNPDPDVYVIFDSNKSLYVLNTKSNIISKKLKVSDINKTFYEPFDMYMFDRNLIVMRMHSYEFKDKDNNEKYMIYRLDNGVFIDNFMSLSKNKCAEICEGINFREWFKYDKTLKEDDRSIKGYLLYYVPILMGISLILTFIIAAALAVKRRFID